MNARELLIGVVITLLAAGSGFAHHSASAFFDLDATVSVEGRVTGARLANPHSYYRVTTDDGVDWAWESAAAWTALAKQGWSDDTLPMGTRVRMTGTPARTGKPIARFSTITAFDETSDEVMILLDADVFGRGRPAWFVRVRELGVPCDNGVNDCTRLRQEAVSVLQEEFGNIGVWSGLDE
jgi:hypothetical protein